MWSFDVFDTCLVRRQAFPSDLFLDVARALRADLEPVLGSDYAEVFREIRVEAERLALREADSEETTLDAIWQKVATLLPGLDPVSGRAQELQIEAESLLPVQATFERVANARQRFGRVVFISDTYLPVEFLQAQLATHGFWQTGDACFVSSTHGLTKRSGRLFTLVAKQLSVPPESIVHHGDNLHSDVNLARQCGLKATLIQYAELSPHERSLAARLPSGNDHANALLIGGIRASRVSRPGSNSAPARQLIDEFVAPFLWVLADWVLTQAAVDRVRTLYFFSRDGCGLHRMASTLALRRGLDVECRYLYVSRQALLLPSVTDVSPQGMPWLRRSWEVAQLDRLLAKLDLDASAVIEHFADLTGQAGAGYVLRSEADWRKFWSVLEAEPVRGLLLAKVAVRRRDALAYFRQEGLLASDDIGVVDLGWHQSCQAALLRILRMERPSASPFAYYLALADGRGPHIGGARARALFHRAPSDRRHKTKQATVFDACALLEHVLNCAPHGSVQHYETEPGVGVSRPALLTTTETEREAKQTLLAEVEGFAATVAVNLPQSDDGTRAGIDAILRLALEQPKSSWADALQNLQVADDQNSRDLSSLIRLRTWRDFFADALHGRNLQGSTFTGAGLWPTLSLAASPANIRRAYTALRFVNALRDRARWRLVRLSRR